MKQPASAAQLLYSQRYRTCSDALRFGCHWYFLGDEFLWKLGLRILHQDSPLNMVKSSLRHCMGQHESKPLNAGYLTASWNTDDLPKFLGRANTDKTAWRGVSLFQTAPPCIATTELVVDCLTAIHNASS